MFLQCVVRGRGSYLDLLDFVLVPSQVADIVAVGLRFCLVFCVVCSLC